MKIVTLGFLGSLITDLHSVLKNTKWRIQYSDLLQNYYSGVFGVLDYRSSFSFKKYKMADPILWSKFIQNNQIYLKIVIQRFLSSLITDFQADLKNTKWRLQYGSRGLYKIMRFTWAPFWICHFDFFKSEWSSVISLDIKPSPTLGCMQSIWLWAHFKEQISISDNSDGSSKSVFSFTLFQKWPKMLFLGGLNSLFLFILFASPMQSCVIGHYNPDSRTTYVVCVHFYTGVAAYIT